MSKEFEYVKEFNKKVLGIEERELNIQPKDEFLLSHMQLKEEAIEYLNSCKNRDIADCVDACIDSIFFAMGILYKMGLTTEEYSKCFRAVYKSNMTKKLGSKENRQGFSSADAIKTDKFVPPETAITEVLNERNNN